MRNRLLLFLLLAIHQIGIADEYVGPYEKYFIISLGDLYRVCEPLKSPGSGDPESYIKSHTCVTYFAGILTGYSSTLAIDAEYHVAKQMDVPRAKIASELDTNHDLHDKVTSISESSQFMCRKDGIHIAKLALTVLENLQMRGITTNRSAHYYVLDELARIQPYNRMQSDKLLRCRLQFAADAKRYGARGTR